MARIRSIHPGLFTDDAFMGLTPSAALLLIGIWTECDDRGVFQWRPLTLKARILPASSAPIDELLAELSAQNFISQFEALGSRYGLVRNFRKFQRPQKPSIQHPLPDEYRKYVGLEEDNPVSVQEQSPTSTIALQDTSGKTSADGGDKMEDGEESRGEKKKYKFAGKLVRLNEADYHNWKKACHTIPDLEAELCRIDLALHAKGTKDWFPAAFSMLNAKHQKLLKEQAPAERKPFAGGRGAYA